MNFLLFASIQGFLLALALHRVGNPNDRARNNCFIGLILIVSLFLLVNSQVRYFGQFPKLFLASYVLVYAYAPMYLLFIRKVAKPSIRLKSTDLLYLLPALIFLSFLARYFIMPADDLMESLKTGSLNDLVLADIICIGFNFYILWKATIEINEWKPGGTGGSEKRIFYSFHAAIFITNVMWCIYLLQILGLTPNFIQISLDQVYWSMSLLIYTLAYIMIASNHHFFNGAKTQGTPYKNVTYPEEELKGVAERIEKSLRIDKPYTDFDFSLNALSKITHTERFKLSYTISSYLNTSFATLINEYRVREFLELTNSQTYAHYTMIGVANEAGFKSKSTFYKAFKDVHGMTPKEYLNVEKPVALF